MIRKTVWSITPSLLLSIGMVGAPASAEGLEHTIAPYIWGTGLDGQVGIGPLDAEVDLSFADILDTLDGGLLLHYEVTGGEWTLLADLVFTDVGTESARVETDYKQTILEVGAGYAVSDGFEFLFGARWTDNDAEIRVFGPGGALDRRAVGSLSWTDPFVGGRWHADLSRKWALRTRLDAGGFGVGSELTWNAALTALYAATDKVTIGIGYRVMDVDYEESDGARIVYDVQMPGALLGVGWSF